MDSYGSDKPDLRFGMELYDVSSEVENCEFGVFTNALKQGGVVKALAVPRQFTRSEIDKITDKAKSEGAGGLPYFTITDGERIHQLQSFQRRRIGCDY